MNVVHIYFYIFLLFYPKEEAIMCLPDVGNYLPNYTASHHTYK